MCYSIMETSSRDLIFKGAVSLRKGLGFEILEGVRFCSEINAFSSFSVLCSHQMHPTGNGFQVSVVVQDKTEGFMGISNGGGAILQKFSNNFFSRILDLATEGTFYKTVSISFGKSI